MREGYHGVRESDMDREWEKLRKVAEGVGA